MSRVYTGRWDWEFYPPPYNALFQGVATPQPAPLIPVKGLGDCGCGCRGHGDCKPQLSGLGFFESWTDFSTWGIAEYAAIAAGAYLLLSAFGDTRRGYKRVATYRRKRAQRSERIKTARKQLAEAERG